MIHEIWEDGLKLHDSAPIGTVVEDADGDVAVKCEAMWIGEGAAPGEYKTQFGPWRVLRWGFSVD